LTTNAARGTALPETILDASDYDLFHSLSAPFDPDVAAWTKQNAYDIKGAMRPTVPSLGADEYSDSLADANPGEAAPRAPVLY
jgi:hypothetical protein